MSKKTWTYPNAVVLSVHDGDTLHFDLDMGFGSHQTEMSCRVYGINAPELSTQEGKDAAAFLKQLLPPGTVVDRVVSHGWDKYGGRYDGEVILAGGTSLADVMVSNGHAIREQY